MIVIITMLKQKPGESVSTNGLPTGFLLEVFGEMLSFSRRLTTAEIKPGVSKHTNQLSNKK
jgi:hypothetical protein